MGDLFLKGFFRMGQERESSGPQKGKDSFRLLVARFGQLSKEWEGEVGVEEAGIVVVLVPGLEVGAMGPKLGFRRDID